MTVDDVRRPRVAKFSVGRRCLSVEKVDEGGRSDEGLSVPVCLVLDLRLRPRFCGGVSPPVSSVLPDSAARSCFHPARQGCPISRPRLCEEKAQIQPEDGRSRSSLEVTRSRRGATRSGSATSRLRPPHQPLHQVLELTTLPGQSCDTQAIHPSGANPGTAAPPSRAFTSRGSDRPRRRRRGAPAAAAHRWGHLGGRRGPGKVPAHHVFQVRFGPR